MESAPVMRSATLDDAPRIAVLAEQLGYPTSATQAARRLGAILANPAHAIVVAEMDSKVVGWTHVLVPDSLLHDATAEVAGLVVDEQCRSRGIGELLMARAEQWARDCGCHAVRVRSNVIRSRAHVFYERLGYRLTKVSKVFTKELVIE